jgi:hypothetical protein
MRPGQVRYDIADIVGPTALFDDRMPDRVEMPSALPRSGFAYDRSGVYTLRHRLPMV